MREKSFPNRSATLARQAGRVSIATPDKIRVEQAGEGGIIARDDADLFKAGVSGIRRVVEGCEDRDRARRMYDQLMGLAAPLKRRFGFGRGKRR